MKKLILVLLLIAGGGAVAFTLYNNKAEMEETTAKAMQPTNHIPVTLEKVSLQSFDRTYEANGVLEPFQEVILMSETSGSVVKILKKKGDFVNKGDLILRIDDQLIQAELLIATLNKEKSAKDLQRFSNLSETDAITKKQLEDVDVAYQIAEAQLKAIQKRTDDTKIKAPISGYINDDFYVPGTLVSPGMPLAHIINKSPLQLAIHVSEYEITQINKGDKFPVKINSLPNQQFEGEVTFISDTGDASFKYEVVLVIKNQDTSLLKPGMFGTATFSSKSTGESIVINRKSLTGGLKDPGVFKVENDRAVFHPIKVKPLNASLVEVTEGLSAGDEIIGTGLINVKEGIQVKVQ
ncbi:efflux RND transporter periplasmic adaptor subunit [Lunatibacter salilacus]|uniref:efflux RND transporter periplasmic adaptor subunit n=1 Tax=Lunatibacter salilacus TaxID=2483804 RepID=UPI00131BC98D|nr:efflux RND transporter periplasmic adaptor subunit [Lunatibacter salilacus]